MAQEVEIIGTVRKTQPASNLSQSTSPSISRVVTDNVGRILVTPYQVRDLIATAYATVSTNTETTLLSGATGTFLDLYQITCANLSTAVLGSATSVQLDIRDGTGGGVVHTLMVNDDVSSSVIFNPPIPSNAAGNTWTVQMANGDLSGTSVKVSATFVQNI